MSVPSRLNNKRPKAEHYVNESIPFQRIYVLDENGEQLGFLTKREAVERAKSSGYDLVVISSDPAKPVAKILDYGKFKYERKKKRKEVKATQATTDNREIRLTPMIGEHDLIVKAKKAREFIMDGDRVKISLKFRGRELARQELGYDTLKRFFKLVEDVAKVEKEAALNGGRFLDLYLTRDKTKAVTPVKETKAITPVKEVVKPKKKETKNAENEN